MLDGKFKILKDYTEDSKRLNHLDRSEKQETGRALFFSGSDGFPGREMGQQPLDS